MLHTSEKDVQKSEYRFLDHHNHYSDQKIRRILRDDLVSYFNDFDLLVLPTAPSTAFNLGEKLNKTLDMYLSDIFTIPISLAGLPAINLPLSKINGLPIGIQICANYFEENKLFALSQFLENQFIN